MKKQLSPLPGSAAATPAASAAIAPRPRRYQQLGCTLGLLLAGCAERYDIGALGNTLAEPPTGNAPQELEIDHDAPLGVLLADGIEDADAQIEGYTIQGAPGDLDGDGFDDVIVGTREQVHGAYQHVLYGGPRPADGVVRLGQRSTALLPADEALNYSVQSHSLLSDFDGDGTKDVAFSTGNGTQLSYALENDEDFVRDQAELPRRWAAVQALLWFGAHERSAQVDLLSAAVAFGDRDDLPSHFTQELAERDPVEAGYNAGLGCQLRWLGDLDGDGFDDLALSSTFQVTWFREEQEPRAVLNIMTRQRQESVSYIYYGGAQLAPGSAAPEPDVRLPGVVLAGIGDVNGDGFGDLSLLSDDGSYYALPGRAQRLTGEISAGQLAVPLQVPMYAPPVSVGDLDGDGIGDLMALGGEGPVALTQLVYGSADLLDDPIDASRVNATFAVEGIANYVSELGDYDGDGANDLLFWNVFVSGDPAQPNTLIPQHDEVRLIRGGAQRLEGRYEVAIEPANLQDEDGFGLNVASFPAGDFDGDGRADVMMRSNPNVPAPLYLKFGGPLPQRPLH